MGLPEDYVLPENYNEAYHLVGDGVVVPVIRFLAAHILEPILASRRLPSDAAGRQASVAETQAHANVRENERQG
jgi:hypothetical protein